jgi:hypothetical protein
MIPSTVLSLRASVMAVMISPSASRRRASLVLRVAMTAGSSVRSFFEADQFSFFGVGQSAEGFNVRRFGFAAQGPHQLAGAALLGALVIDDGVSDLGFEGRNFDVQCSAKSVGHFCQATEHQERKGCVGNVIGAGDMDVAGSSVENADGREGCVARRSLRPLRRKPGCAVEEETVAVGTFLFTAT